MPLDIGALFDGWTGINNTLLGAPGSERRTGSRQALALGGTVPYLPTHVLPGNTCCLAPASLPHQHNAAANSPGPWPPGKLSRLKQRLGRRISDPFLPVFIFVVSPRLFCQG